MSKRKRNLIVRFLQRGEEWLFANPKTVLGMIFTVTVLFSLALPGLRVYSDFADLLPQHHPYIQVYNQIKERFGGANTLIMAIEVEQGTIFSDEALKQLNLATQQIDSLPGVNHDLISSLTHRSVRQVYIATDGGFVSKPYYDSLKPRLSAAELEQLRRDVVTDPNVYGLLVSANLKAGLIKAQLNDSDIDYVQFFKALRKIRASLEKPGYKVYVTGNPVLTGWVYTYVNQIVAILAWTLALLAALLTVYFRRLYGIALPLLGIALSSIWGLGFMSLVGINLEPLSLPIPFLIAARATSHGVQLVARYYEELARVQSAKKAARNALEALFRPGSLAITVDALGIAAMVLGAAPFNHKLGIAAGFWSFSVIFTVHFMVPLALTVLPQPKNTSNANQGVRNALGAVMARLGGNNVGARVILAGALLAVLGSSFYLARVQVGDSEPGSPLLRRNHDYNLSTGAINGLFPGSEELTLLASTSDKQGIRRPEVLAGIERFQWLMMNDPNVGGTRAFPGLIRAVNWITHSNDPRWMQIPESPNEVGGLSFAYIASSPIPDALRSFISADEDQASVTFYYKDHQASTVSRAIAAAQDAIARIQAQVPGLHLYLGGGIVGVSAAVNQALLKDQFIVIPMALFLAFLLVAIYYRSAHAGWLMILPMLFAIFMTFAFMGWANMGISVATVPVVAVGVGVGIDYAVYFMDRIREEMHAAGDIHQAVIKAFSTTGYAVSFTATTLIAGVGMWIFMSDLRFQSDTALLLSFMLLINAIAAMLIVPAWCVVFRPRFVVAAPVVSAASCDWSGKAHLVRKTRHT